MKLVMKLSCPECCLETKVVVEDDLMATKGDQRPNYCVQSLPSAEAISNMAEERKMA